MMKFDFNKFTFNLKALLDFISSARADFRWEMFEDDFVVSLDLNQRIIAEYPGRVGNAAVA